MLWCLASDTSVTCCSHTQVRSRNDVLLYKRAWAGDEFLVAFNTVHQPRKLDWDGNGKVLLSTYLDEDVKRISGSYLLRPDEGIIVKLGV